MYTNTAWFRFYEELNDILPVDKRKISFPYQFSGSPAVKDIIEAIGVPHTEVDLILVNGNSVKFDHKLFHGDHVSVYPVFENLDISPVTRLRPKPLRTTRFIADVHLGKLSRLLRMLGFDTLYHNNYTDEDIITTALSQKRIILTGSRRLLKNRSITHGCLIKEIQPVEQVRDVMRRFDLYSQAKPFSRCMDCNWPVESTKKDAVIELLQPGTIRHFDDFTICTVCKKVYWKGSHYKKMKKAIASINRWLMDESWG